MNPGRARRAQRKKVTPSTGATSESCRVAVVKRDPVGHSSVGFPGFRTWTEDDNNMLTQHTILSACVGQ